MDVHKALPHAALRPFVSDYRSRIGDVGPSFRIALPARAYVFLEFYFTTPHLLEMQRTGMREPAPWSVAVGVSTFRRVDLLLSGRIEVFTIAFTPTGLHALFGVPMPLLTDVGIEADQLLGAQTARDLHDALAAASTLAERARMADDVLLDRLASREIGIDAGLVASAAECIRRRAGRGEVSAVIASDVMPVRRFRRLFEEQVGVTPKLYARIVRVNAAIDAKSVDAARSWADVAHEFGWFDQAHMDKDFHALAGAAPSAFPLAHRAGR